MDIFVKQFESNFWFDRSFSTTKGLRLNGIDQKYASEIGEIMKATRKRLRLKQGDVAKALQVSQSAVSKFESGTLVPSAVQWFEFCRLIGISPDILSMKNKPKVLAE